MKERKVKPQIPFSFQTIWFNNFIWNTAKKRW